MPARFANEAGGHPPEHSIDKMEWGEKWVSLLLFFEIRNKINGMEGNFGGRSGTVIRTLRNRGKSGCYEWVPGNLGPAQLHSDEVVLMYQEGLAAQRLLASSVSPHPQFIAFLRLQT